MAAPEGETRFYQIRSPGPLSTNLILASAPRPSDSLTGDKLLVQVFFAGLNPADYKFAEAGLIAKIKVSFPKSVGMDFSGRVLAVGPDVSDIKPGDSVLGRMPIFGTGGALSEYLVASYDDVAVLPENVTLEQGGGAATVGLTAYQTMVPFISAGDKIFINGGSGGTGTAAIQIAKLMGCHVAVSCSTSKVALCQQLGADEIIDYKTTDVATWLRNGGKVFKLAIDNVGNTNLFGMADAFLTPDGGFRLVGAPSSLTTTWNLVYNLASSKILPRVLGGSRHKFDAYTTRNSHEELAQIAAWMGEGKLKTVIDSVFPFEDALKAYEKLKIGSSTGKILLRVREEK